MGTGGAIALTVGLVALAGGLVYVGVRLDAATDELGATRRDVERYAPALEQVGGAAAGLGGLLERFGIR